MQRKHLKLGLTLIPILLLSSCASTYEDGIAAIRSNDRENAADIFNELAEKGDVQAMYQLYKNIDHSKQWLKKSADAGYSLAQYEYGIYLLEEDVSHSFSDGVSYLKKSAHQSNENADLYLRNNHKIIKLKLNAEQGDATAQFRLGWMYGKGRGVKRNDQEAAVWFHKAAEQNFALAQFNLGVMYGKGRGVKQSDQEAVAWYRKAAEQGLAIAQFRLGGRLYYGQGVKQNDQEAVRWYRKAAEQGDATAQFSLGVMYAKGRGVKQSDQEAVRWYQLAAEKGYARAQNNLGAMYESGLGVKQDFTEAVKWYQLATAQGNTDAKNNIARVRLLVSRK